MGGSPKKPKAVPAPVPSPYATTVAGEGGNMDSFAPKDTVRKSGYSKTVLTGALAPQRQNKKRRLG